MWSTILFKWYYFEEVNDNLLFFYLIKDNYYILLYRDEIILESFKIDSRHIGYAINNVTENDSGSYQCEILGTLRRHTLNV